MGKFKGATRYPWVFVLIIFVWLSIFSLSGCSPVQQQSAQGNDPERPVAADQDGSSPGNFDADEYYARLLDCAEQIKERTDFVPDIVLVLGSGLGGFAEKLDVVETIPYSEISGWPQTTVEGHEGNLVFATIEGKNIAVMQGRVHYYEGYDMHEVVLPIRVLHILGAETVILTNATGAINESFSIGDFMVVEDHIAAFVPSPLRGENIDELGVRFPGMSEIYDEELRDIVLEIGQEENINVHSGIFVQSAGPQFETPAEISMFRIAGADTVSMSSAVEATAAVHMGMRVCMINCITNMAAGVTATEPSNDDVKINAKRFAEDFDKLITGVLRRLEP